MAAELSASEIVYEKVGVEPALVLKLRDLSKLDNPAIVNLLKSIGLSAEEFGKILRLEFKSLNPPKEFPWLNNKGEKLEDVVERTADTSIGQIEVADIKLYPAVVTGKDDVSLHLKVGQHGGFEAILALEGKATLSFPKNVEPTEGGYVASIERDHVELTPNTLAIIPAPTANYWSLVGEGFKFRYLCQPKWSADFVRPVLG